jgi:ABC-type transport system involved in multi-copper enzyme maturation permease subunit
MTVIPVLALIAIKEAIGKKVIYLPVFFACAIIFASRIFTSITPGAEISFMTDIGLVTISFLGGVTVLFLASDFIPDEIRKRTIYTVLTYPVRRFEFILGKFLGISGIVLIVHFLMSLIFLAALSLSGASIKPDIIIALTLIYGTLLIFSSIVIMGSTFLSPLINIIFSLFFHLLGHLVVYIRHLAERVQVIFTKFILTFFSYLIPDLQRFEVKDKLVIGQALPLDVTANCFRYAAVYITCIMMLTYIFFNKKEV